MKFLYWCMCQAFLLDCKSFKLKKFSFAFRESKFSWNKHCRSEQQKGRWRNLCWLYYERVSSCLQWGMTFENQSWKNGSYIIFLVLFCLNVNEFMFLLLKGCCWFGWKNRTWRHAPPGRYLIKLFSLKESWNLSLYSKLSLCKLTLFGAFCNNLWMSVVFLTIQSWSI